MVTDRIRYIALAVATIVAGLLVHLGGTALPSMVRDPLGDALWAMMIAWWIGALVPARPLLQRTAIALALCIAVELSQLLHTPALDALRRTTPGHLVLGSDFDPRDLLAYGVGVLAAMLLERWRTGRHAGMPDRH